MAFYYLRPDESLWGGSASGAVAADFDAAWLVDGRPGRPAKGASGTVSWGIQAPSAIAGFSIIAVCNHNVDAGRDIEITGDVTATLTVPAWGKDGIPLNPFALVTPASLSSFSVDVAGNSAPVVVGEVVGGPARTLERQLRLESNFEALEPLAWDGRFGSVPPYDEGTASRMLKGTTFVTGQGYADIQAWYESTRRGTRPTLIVPDSATNDAWLVTFKWAAAPLKVPSSTYADQVWRVELEFYEVPRTRW